MPRTHKKPSSVKPRKKTKASIEKKSLSIKKSSIKKSDVTVRPAKGKLRYKYVRGPVTATVHYSKALDMCIWTFGDVHERKSKCPDDSTSENTMSIHHFIAALLTEAEPNQVDVFTETDMLENKDTVLEDDYRHTYIYDVENHFEACFILRPDGKKRCSWHNARFHYVDPREMKTPEMQALGKLENGLESLMNGTKTELPKWREYRKILSVGVPKLLQKIKVTKQIDAVPESKIQKALKEQAKLIKLDLPSEEELENAIETQDEEELARLIDDFFTFRIALMDLYLLGRLFRQFTNPDTKKKEPRSRYKIIFAGDLHADNYREFFEQVGFKKLHSSKSKSKSKATYQCVDISRFDSYWPKRKN